MLGLGVTIEGGVDAATIDVAIDIIMHEIFFLRVDFFCWVGVVEDTPSGFGW